jgi:hypothetical protein
MPDFGLYMALRGQDDWQTKRADARFNMAIAEKREQRAQQALNESIQMDAGIVQAMDAMKNLDVLPQDRERVKAVELEARKKIKQGIAKYNGDLKKFLASGGNTIMADYKNSVLQSEEVANAMQNKMNLQTYLQDRSANKRAMSVTVDIPFTDENGQQMMKPTRMTMEEQVKLFNEGKIKKLTYSGAENKINLGIEDFSKMFKDPKNPYSADNYVTESDIYKKMLSKGASEEYARDTAMRYGNMIKQGGRAWMWGAKDPLDTQLKLQQLQINKEKIGAMREQRAAAKSTAGATNLITNYFGKINYLKPGQGMPEMSTAKKLLTESLGIQKIEDGQSNYGGKFRYSGDVIGPDMKTPIKNNQLEIVEFPSDNSIMMLDDGKVYMRAIARSSNDHSTEEGGFGNSQSWFDEADPNMKPFINDKSSWLGMSGHYEAPIFIPIDHLVRNDYTRNAMNKEMGIRTNMTNPYTDFNQGAENMMGDEWAGGFNETFDEGSME